MKRNSEIKLCFKRKRTKLCQKENPIYTLSPPSIFSLSDHIFSEMTSIVGIENTVQELSFQHRICLKAITGDVMAAEYWNGSTSENSSSINFFHPKNKAENIFWGLGVLLYV